MYILEGFLYYFSAQHSGMDAMLALPNFNFVLISFVLQGGFVKIQR